MPRTGGAIQPANRPASTTRPIKELTNAWSASVGSQRADPAPRLGRHDLAFRADVVTREHADPAMEPDVRQDEPAVEAELLGNAVPPGHGGLDFAPVIITQPGIEGGECRDILADHRVAVDLRHGVLRLRQRVIVGDLLFLVAPLQAPVYELPAFDEISPPNRSRVTL